MAEKIAVIGSQYGDCGKGLTTDFLCHKMMKKYGTNNGLVIRFNSGAQAGHTVVTPEGWRHVHSHIGSGWNLDIPTYLSKHFVCNPFILLKEEQMSVNRLILHASHECLVTTHYDMFFNQVLEDTRSDKHGSCGLGFNETIQRSRFVYFNLGDLKNRDYFYKIVPLIKKYYYEFRIPQAAMLFGLKESKLKKEYDKKLKSFNDDLMIHTILDLPNKLYLTTAMPQADFYIFEGAQGLMLDQTYGKFPYVTRSNTGLQNVKQILNEFDMGPLNESVYVTRAYSTRHGNGPFSDWEGSVLFDKFEDKTNVTNTYQGTFRYAPNNPEKIIEKSVHDFMLFGNRETKFSFMMTCLDQMEDEIPIIKQNQLEYRYHGAYFDMFPHMNYVSYGPTRNDVTEI